MKTFELEQKRQLDAFNNFKRIMPGDSRAIQCAEADEKWCRFKLRSGDILVCEQPENSSPIEMSEIIPLTCSRVEIGQNGYGLFVDYVFLSNRLNHTVRINGPDAQALTVVSMGGIRAGDKVMINGTTLGSGYPRYLEGAPLTVVGFTRVGTVKCDYDGGRPFNIPAEMLKKIRTEKEGKS